MKSFRNENVLILYQQRGERGKISPFSLFWGQTARQTDRLTHLHERFVEGPSTLKNQKSKSVLEN